MPVQTSPIAQPVFCDMGTGPFPVGTQPGHATHHPLLSSTKAGNGSELHHSVPAQACQRMNLTFPYNYTLHLQQLICTAQLDSWSNTKMHCRKTRQNRCIFSRIFFHTFLLGSTSSGHAEMQTHSASPSSLNSQTRPAPQCFFAHGSAEHQAADVKTYASNSIHLFQVRLKPVKQAVQMDGNKNVTKNLRKQHSNKKTYFSHTCSVVFLV